MIVDSRVYLGSCLFGYGQTVHQVLSKMDRLGIDRAVLVPAKPPAYHLGPANDLVAECVAQHPHRFVGLCRVDPWQGEGAVAEARRCLGELGACGLYLDPWEENFQINEDLVAPLVEEAGGHGRPVVVNAGHVRVSHPTQIWDLARRFPGVQFVAGNGGQINICGMLLSETRRMLEACSNVTIDTAGTYREDFLEEIVTEVGEERVMFASGSPVYDQEFEMARVRLAHLTASQKAKVWGSNAVEVFGIPVEAG
jgi:predicted TIM-barrel fold metal-dependent hydrolase